MNTPSRSGGGRLHGGCSHRSQDGGRSAPRLTASGASPVVRSGYEARWTASRLHGHQDQRTPLVVSGPMSTVAMVSKNSLSRKMHDPASRNEAIRTVLRYLTTRGFPRQVSAQELQSPAKALYVSVMEFLIIQVDNQSRIKDPEEDICRFFKDVACPLTITKSAIKAPGAPTTWPTLLMAMSWLCELLIWDEMVCQPMMGDGAHSALDIPEEQRTFDQQIQVCYRRMLEENLDEAGAREVLERQREKDHAAARERLGQLETEIQRTKTAISQMQTHVHSMEEQRGRTVKLAKDADNLTAAVEKCERDAIEVRNSNKVKEITLSERKAELENIERENKRLQSIVDAQEINKEEVVQIEDKMVNKRSLQQQLRAEKIVSDKERFQLADEASQLAFRLRNQAREHNALAESFKEISQVMGSKLAPGTSKAIKAMKPLELSVDEKSLDDCAAAAVARGVAGEDSSSSEAEDLPLDPAFDENGRPSSTESRGKGLGNVDLAKSTPAFCGRPKGASKRNAEKMEIAAATCSANIDIFLGLRWKWYKSLLLRALKEEALNCERMKEENASGLRKFEKSKIDVSENRTETRRVTEAIETVCKDTKSLKRQIEVRKLTAAEDLKRYEEAFRQVDVDLGMRVSSAKARTEELQRKLAASVQQMQTEVKEARNGVIQLGNQVTDFRNYCRERIKCVAENCDRNFVNMEERASAAYRHLNEPKSRVYSPA